MAFDVTPLADYVNQNREGLIGQTVTMARSTQLFDLQTGFKFKGAINRIDTDVIFNDNSSCGRTANGTTKLDQRILEVGEISVNEDLCPKDLNKKYTNQQMAQGSKDDAIPFEEEWTDLKVKKVLAEQEKAIWQGDKASGNANLNKFDGLIKIIDAEGSDVVNGNTTNATAITSDNIDTLINAMYVAIPESVLEAGDAAILVGTEIFRMYVMKLVAANLFHYKESDENLEVTIPGTTTKVIAIPGLSGTNRMFAGRIGSQGGFVIGTDLEGEEEQFKVWYSEDDKVVKLDIEWKMGTQIKFPEELVEFTLVV